MFGRGKFARERGEDQFAVIGAGGASGYRPSMSAASLEMAVAQGADGVTVMVVASSDGVLFAVSSLNLAEGTDVAKHIWAASRYSTQTINGVTAAGWFAHDFSAEELVQLHYTEPIGRQRARSFEHSGVEPLLTLNGALSTVQSASAVVDIYVDVVEPTFHQRRGVNYVDAIAESLAATGWRSNDARVAIISPEKTLLTELRSAGIGSRYLYRCDAFGTAADEMAKPDGERRSYLMELRPETIGSLGDYCDGVLVPLSMIDSVLSASGTANVATQLDQSLIHRAHDAGLAIIGHTLRAENRFRPDHLKKGVDPSGTAGWEEYFQRVLAYELDGMLCDQPDMLREAHKLVVQ